MISCEINVLLFVLLPLLIRFNMWKLIPQATCRSALCDCWITKAFGILIISSFVYIKILCLSPRRSVETDESSPFGFSFAARIRRKRFRERDLSSNLLRCECRKYFHFNGKQGRAKWSSALIRLIATRHASSPAHDRALMDAIEEKFRKAENNAATLDDLKVMTKYLNHHYTTRHGSKDFEFSLQMLRLSAQWHKSFAHTHRARLISELGIKTARRRFVPPRARGTR